MLIVAGTIQVDPDSRDAATDALLEMMRETRKEPGNLEYAFTPDLADPGLLRIFEQWESQEALDAHFAAPHMAAFQKAIAGFSIKGMSVEKFEVKSSGPVR